MAQTISATTNVRDSSAVFSLYSAQDSNYIDLSNYDGEEVVIVVRNENDAVAVETATITVSPASSSAIGPWMRDLGTLTVSVADANSMKTIGPLSTARFKGTTGLVTVNVSVTQSGTASSVKLGVIQLP